MFRKNQKNSSNKKSLSILLKKAFQLTLTKKLIPGKNSRFSGNKDFFHFFSVFRKLQAYLRRSKVPVALSMFVLVFLFFLFGNSLGVKFHTDMEIIGYKIFRKCPGKFFRNCYGAIYPFPFLFNVLL